MQFGGQHPGGLGVPTVGMALPGYVAQQQMGMGNNEMAWYIHLFLEILFSLLCLQILFVYSCITGSNVNCMDLKTTKCRQQQYLH